MEKLNVRWTWKRKNYKWTLIIDAVSCRCEVCCGEETDIQQDGGAVTDGEADRGRQDDLMCATVRGGALPLKWRFETSEAVTLDLKVPGRDS